MTCSLISSAAVLGAMALAWWAASRRQVAVFGMAWCLLFLLPVSNIVPLSILLAERYLYMPLLGLCMVAGDALDRLQGRVRHAGFVCGLVAALCLAAVTHSRQAVWQNTLSFWRQGVGEWPGAPVGRLGLSVEREANGWLGQASRQDPTKSLAHVVTEDRASHGLRNMGGLQRSVRGKSPKCWIVDLLELLSQQARKLVDNHP